ncbi:MAG: cupin domain-containing protein [Candidatus Cybelea sp.]
MKNLLKTLIVLGCVCSFAGLAAAAADAPTIVMGDQAKFAPAPVPYPSGSMMAVLSGDPTEASSQYTVRLKLPDGTKIAPHTHGDIENVTVLSGTLMVGVGNSVDPASMLALTPGSYASIPAGTPHYAMAKGETVVQVNGVGPASITLVK